MTDISDTDLELLAGGVTVTGLPYPDPTDPLADGANAIRRLAEAIDADYHDWTIVTPASGWSTGTGSTAFAVKRIGYVIYTRGTLYGGTAGSTAATMPTWARPRVNVTVPLPGQTGVTSTITIAPTGIVTFAGPTAGLSSGQASYMMAN